MKQQELENKIKELADQVADIAEAVSRGDGSSYEDRSILLDFLEKNDHARGLKKSPCSFCRHLALAATYDQHQPDRITTTAQCLLRITTTTNPEGQAVFSPTKVIACTQQANLVP